LRPLAREEGITFLALPVVHVPHSLDNGRLGVHLGKERVDVVEADRAVLEVRLYLRAKAKIWPT